MVQFAPVVAGITFSITFHMHLISIVRFSYFRISSPSFWIIFYSPEIALYINRSVSFSLSRIMMSGLLLGMVLAV
jgi:hypothetical protein